MKVALHCRYGIGNYQNVHGMVWECMIMTLWQHSCIQLLESKLHKHNGTYPFHILFNQTMEVAPSFPKSYTVNYAVAMLIVAWLWSDLFLTISMLMWLLLNVKIEESEGDYPRDSIGRINFISQDPILYGPCAAYRWSLGLPSCMEESFLLAAGSAAYKPWPGGQINPSGGFIWSPIFPSLSGLKITQKMHFSH